MEIFLSIKGANIPVGTTLIKIKVNVNKEPVGNTLKNKFGITVLDPKYQAFHKESNETNVIITKPITATINQVSTQIDATKNLLMVFTVVFSEAIDPLTFTSNDILLSGTGSGTVGIPTTTDNITWTIPVNGTNDGTYIANLPLNTVKTLNGGTIKMLLSLTILLHLIKLHQ